MEPDATISEKPPETAATGRNFTRVPLVEFIDGLLAESESATVTMMRDQLARVEALLEKQAAAPGMSAEDTGGPGDPPETFTNDRLFEKICKR